MNTSIENKLRLNYWVNKLESCPVVNDMPLTILETKELVIDKDDLNYFNKLSGGNEIVEYTVLLSIYNILLQRYFETVNFIHSFTIEKEEQALLYKFGSVKEKSFKQCLNEVKDEVKEVLKYSNCDFNSIDKNPFYSYTNYGFSFNRGFSNKKDCFPFYLVINKKEEGLAISISYDENFTTEYVANHFLKNIIKVLLNLESCINVDVEKISIISEQEKEEVLYKFNSTTVDYSKDKTLIDLFEQQVERTPNNVAIVFDGKQLTYKEVNEQSNCLAQYLREAYDIQPDDLIGIKLNRSEQLLVAILAILKSGAAYVPIDINYPQERIDYIEKDSNCKVVIDEERLEIFKASKGKYSFENLQKITNSNHLAYVIYTSGTTGNPKGVMIMHSNAVAMLNWAINEFDTDKYEVVYAVTSHCFDLSIYEMFYPLSIGKKIKLFENALSVGEELQHDEKVLINTVPSSIRNLIDSGISFDNAAYINLAGEPFPVDIAKKLLATNAEIRNLYGPSEDTTYSTTYTLSSNKDYKKTIPIGKPISNSSCYILDDNLSPLPIGITGKLYIGGAGITKGYLNKNELTLERYIANPFIKGELMYYTGDLCKWMPDGNIEFLGRKDSQVKIRGYRIELEEIENTIAQFSADIQQVVLDVKVNGNAKELVAYYVAKSDIEKSALKAFLEDKLPSFMIPSYYVILDAIPLTPNGKIDKKALPKITSSDLIQKAYVAPRNEVERQLVEIWKEVLGIEKIGITDNFFDLGGHSLLVGQIINRVYKRLNKSVSFKSFFKNPTIKESSKELSNSTYTAIPKVENRANYPLTTAQHRIWVLSQLEGGNLAYNISGAVKLKGDFDVLKFETAFKELIRRHEILRTNFKVNKAGEIHQYILSENACEFRLLEKSVLNQTKGAVETLLQKEYTTAFDLANGLLIRATVFQTKKQEYIFSLTMHHIIGDGWSLELLISEVISIYNKLVQNIEIELPKLEVQYKDYAVWLESELSKKDYQRSEKYWLSQFEGELPILDLPSFKTRPQVQTYNGNTLAHTFSSSFLEKLKIFSKSNDVTLFMTLMSGINSLLHHYTNQNDIIVGTPIAGREHPDLEGQLGLYLNTLAIRTTIKESDSFLDLLEHQKQILLSAYEHQNYPFDELVEKLNLKRDTSRSVLFDVMVVLQNQVQLHSVKNDRNLHGINVEDYEINRSTTQFDVSFTFVEKEEGLELNLEYNTDIYDAFLIERIFTHYENLMNYAIEHPNDSILTIEYFTEKEKQQLLEKFNDTKVDYPKDKTIVDLFEEQVKEIPNNIAVVFDGKQLSYKELNEQANQLAQYIREIYAIQANDLIGIKLDRDEQLLVAIFGVLKSGAAYVPIDINYPQERINYIEKDSSSKVVIDKSFLEEFEKEKSKYRIENLEKLAEPKDLAYIIYTSGTTGNPKGVMIKNSNLYDYSLTVKQYFNITETDSLLQQASISFDTSVEEIFPILISGGKLVVIKENNDFDKLFKKCEEEKITLLSTNPYALEFLNQNLSHYTSLNFRVLISGGDTLNIEYISDLYNVFDVYNTYGPTESTVCATYYKVKSLTKIVPIGKPISNRNIFIVNDKNILKPIGVVGELCISGLGLASGYLNKNEITKAKFINTSYSENNRMYKTGDLARWLPDGNIEFLGRKDSQVKLRGYRIELGEIETVIKQYSKDINNVIVAVKEINQEKVLIGYYVSNSIIEKAHLKEFLKERIPAYMIPNFYLQLDSFVLTPNGKIDRKSLPSISGEDSVRKEYIAPNGDTETALVSIWEEVLGIEKIGITDNFFDLGGHSLKISKLRNLVNKEFNTTLSFNDFFIGSTIKNQSKLVKESAKAIYQDIPKLLEQTSYVLSSSQRRIWMLSHFDGGNTAYNMPGIFMLEGEINIDAMEKAFYALIDRHESLRTKFKEDDSTGEIEQIIYSAKESDFELLREEANLVNASVDDLKRIVEIESSYAFDLSHGNLLRAKLIKIGENKSLLIFVIHHIICDGWSLEIITNELFLLYNAFLNKKESPLLPLKIQYKEYASWEQSQLSLDKTNDSKQYWEKQFEEELPILELPTNKKRPLYKTYTGKSIIQILSKETFKEFKSLCKSNNSTLFMGLLSLVKFLLYKYSNQKDIIVGTPIAGREHALLQNQIGVYINTLALRTKFNGDDSFKTLIKKVKEVTLGAYEHQSYPFDKLVSDLPLQRDLSRSPLFDVMVTLQNTDNSIPEINSTEGLNISEFNITDTVMSKFDLEFIFEEKKDELEIALLYNTNIFDSKFIEEIQEHLKIGIESCIGFPEEPLCKIPFLTKAEENELLNEFNDTLQAYNEEETFLDIFKIQVKSQPDAIAVVDENQAFSYKDLDVLSTQIAVYLSTNFENEKEAFGVLLDRSITTIAVILGILKSGRAYIPLDPTFPIERLKYIVEHSGMKVLISTEALSETAIDKVTFITTNEILSKARTIEENVEFTLSGEDTAYIIYTSGSTGKPKGVEIGHRSLLNFLLSIKEKPGVKKNDSLFAVTTYSFDISILEFFTPLIAGASVYIVSNESLSDPEKTIKLIEDIKPSIIQATPSFYQQLFDIGWKGDKQIKILCGGDALSESLADQLLKSSLELWNMYGPTETTIWSTMKKIESSNQSNIIGKPIANTSLYILDEFLQLQPKGTRGNLFIGGHGLAKGYYKQNELTAKRFIKNPFSNGFLYDTGDVVKWNDKEELVFLGRNDNQVKIRGYRIELGDIETKMNGIEDIDKSIVIAKKDPSGEKVLIAYFTSEKDKEINDLRNQLKEVLPYYMIPSQYIKLDVFPLTPNKKINRKALANLDDVNVMSSVVFIPASTEVEKKLSLLWKEILGVEQIGIKDNFFDLGGHSLSVTKLVSKIQKEFLIKISINKIFEHSILEEQSRLIENIQIINQTVIIEDEETQFENFLI